MPYRVAGSLGIFLFVLVESCSAPHIRIERSCPPCIQLESGAKVGLEIALEIPPGAAETVVAAVSGQVLSRREAAEPVGRELGRHLQMSPYPFVDARAADVIVRACPTQWTYQAPFPPLPGQNGFGHLRVHIEVIRAKNPSAPCIYSSTYWSKVHAPGEAMALAKAADLVADRILGDLRPSRVCNVVEMDDSDPRVETGISLCTCGQFDAAYTAFSDAAARAPESAPVLYDLAVLKESRGEYAEAEALLLRATRIYQNAIYYVALERVRAARLDAEALGRTPQ